jgi:hypothetical protein
MLSNNTKGAVHWMAGRFPELVGHLYSPKAQRGPYKWLPYALDNGAFGAFKSGSEWDESVWIELLEWAKLSGQAPLWALVPDVVGDRIRTLRKWGIYAPIARRYGWPLAFAVQDGMTESDVPRDADVVFVGGSTEWKWSTVGTWARFPWCHVGRVNEYRRLVQCEELGVKSVDGTGWLREPDGRQWRGYVAWCEEVSGLRTRRSQQQMWVA